MSSDERQNQRSSVHPSLLLCSFQLVTFYEAIFNLELLQLCNRVTGTWPINLIIWYLYNAFDEELNKSAVVANSGHALCTG